jgi:uncharacterized protein DUF397
MTAPHTSALTGAKWRKSSYTEQADCVEVSHAGPTCAVRDSKDPHGAHLTFGITTWRAFLADIKTGRHDH